MKGTRSDLCDLADALDTAYGCLDLVRSGARPIDLDDCIAEVKAARDKALDLMEQGIRSYGRPHDCS